MLEKQSQESLSVMWKAARYERGEKLEVFCLGKSWCSGINIWWCQSCCSLGWQFECKCSSEALGNSLGFRFISNQFCLGFFFLICSVLKPSCEALGVSFPLRTLLVSPPLAQEQHLKSQSFKHKCVWVLPFQFTALKEEVRIFFLLLQRKQCFSPTSQEQKILRHKYQSRVLN